MSGGGRGLRPLGELPIGTGTLSSTLSASLAAAGVATLPAQGSVGQGASSAGSTTNTSFAQLLADVQKLQSENQTLAARSMVTVADLSHLQTDSQTIAGAGLRLDPQSLQKVMSELVTAVAGGTSTSQAQTDFNALFTGSNVAQTSIDQTFTDLIQTIQDSKVTAADLTTLTADQTAVQTDRSSLRSGAGMSVTSATGTTGSGSGGSSGSGSGGGTGSGTGTGTSTTTTPLTTHFARLRRLPWF